MSNKYYDENNNLIKYEEFLENSNLIKSFYEVDGRFLNRIFLEQYEGDDGEFIQEYLNSKIEYSDDIFLFPLTLNGEVYMNIIKKGKEFNFNSRPSIISSIHTKQPIGKNFSKIENFTLKKELILQYLEKL